MSSDPPAQPPTAPPRREPSRREADVVALIALGGGLGALARYGLARLWPTRAGCFPWATFVTNVAGCLAMGVLLACVLHIWPPSRYRRPFLGTGILGGFTTFSTYVVETRGLLSVGHLPLAVGYALGSVVSGVAGAWLGLVLTRRIASRVDGSDRSGPSGNGTVVAR